MQNYVLIGLKIKLEVDTELVRALSNAELSLL